MRKARKLPETAETPRPDARHAGCSRIRRPVTRWFMNGRQSDGEVWPQGQKRSEKGGEQDEEGDATQRQKGKGQEPKAGDCDRPVQGAKEGGQSATQEKVVQEKELVGRL